MAKSKIIIIIKNNTKLSRCQYGLAFLGKRTNIKSEILDSPARAEIKKYKSTSAMKYHNQTQT